MGLITGACGRRSISNWHLRQCRASFGPSSLWTAPVTLPMMFAVVYLSAQLGQAGQGFFAVMRRHYSPWLVYPTLIGVLIGNTIEAGADLGGVAAAINLLIPVQVGILVVAIAVIILGLQLWGSYTLLRNIFRILALALLAYIPAAILARPDLIPC